ncbi:MAG: glycogen/starch synthase [Gammaproteobacteria bacterium]|nr:glycogen/starch synthase [Gammaproteobacteria bacterium]
MHIVMIAAENGALAGGKVGGIGDVIRDVPLALAAQGQTVSVVTPGYQALSVQNPATSLGSVTVRFCGQPETLELYRVEPRVSTSSPSKSPTAKKKKVSGVTHYVLEHPLFAACGPGAIYCNDHFGPFATDAHKFALFSAAVCELLCDGRLVDVDVLHLHDWHAAMIAVLRRHAVSYRALRDIPVVYSIHNLSLQGIRPLSGDGSSLHSWFPELVPDLSSIQDPRHWDCINLMRAGITLSDRVHAVSPSYAREILVPTDLAHGFIGGESLERDLLKLQDKGQLIGILNGCDYDYPATPHRSRAQLLDLIESCLLSWVGDKQYVPAAHFYAQRTVAQWRRRRKPVTTTLTSVGRITAQKSRLLREPVSDGKGGVTSALERMLQELGDGVFIMVGSGDEDYEHFFASVMSRCENFLFLRGFSETLADALYSAGDLFMMPSSYEPCGISQMLAMRAGTPCVVHHVGGLRDTVQHGVNGFAFTGNTPGEQAEHMLDVTRLACSTVTRPAQWQSIRRAAQASRFSWDVSVRRYIEELYSH